jgi:spoIIIJ-associated protein
MQNVQSKSREFFDFLDATVSINPRVVDDIVFIDITTSDPNDQTLIGIRGDILFSLQLLLSLVLNRDESEPLQVVLDVNEYRVRREKAIQELMQRVVEQVVATGNPYDLDPMRPFERRIIHVILQDYPELDSYSVGEEPNRHVVIKKRD